MKAADSIDVRAYVSAQTRAIHQALHDDPVLHRLTAAGITADEYSTALRALSWFYHAVEDERQRLDHWAAFALKEECHALASDLGGRPELPLRLKFSNRFELLGGLYVAHGASFGRAQFRHNLKKWVPDAPQMFVGIRLCKPVWQQLTKEMEHFGQDPIQRADLVKGAAQSFDAVEAASNTVRLAHSAL
jgi:heme oxygenase